MRSVALMVAACGVASCTTAPPPPTAPSPRAQAAAARVLGGKVARAPISCLPHYNANDMTIIDGHTLAFRSGMATTYVVHLTQGCELVGTGNYALLSRQFGGTGLCRGDIQEVIDTSSRMNVGSCTIADITPYVRP